MVSRSRCGSRKRKTHCRGRSIGHPTWVTACPSDLVVSWAAWSVRDEAVLIDLGKYHLIDLDTAGHTVAVSPSMTGAMLNGFPDTKGLLFAGGQCPDLGLGGFLLQDDVGNWKNWAEPASRSSPSTSPPLLASSSTTTRPKTQNSSGPLRGAGLLGHCYKFHLQRCAPPATPTWLSSTFKFQV